MSRIGSDSRRLLPKLIGILLGYAELISRLGRLTSRSLKLFITSRDEDLMRKDARASQAIELSIRAKDEFIRSYTEARLLRIANRDPNSEHIGASALPDVLKSGKLKQVCDKIVEAAEGNFYYAELQITTLKAEITPEDVEKSLDSLAAKSLADIIREAIERIRNQKDADQVNIGMKTLMWAVYASRTLTIEELRHAVALTARPYIRDDAHAHEIEVTRLSPHVLIKATRYFLRVDEKNGQVGIHKAMKDYCDKANVFEDAHYQMSETCLTFLDRRCFSLQCESKEEYVNRKREHPFYEYAARHWGLHMRKAGEGRFLGHTSPVSMNTLLNRPMFLNCVAVALHEDLQRYRMWEWHKHDPWRTLRARVHPVLRPSHLLVYFDLQQTLDWSLRRNKDDVGRPSQTGTTPLYLACNLGRMRVLESLLFDFNASPVDKGAEPFGHNLAAAVFVQSPEIVQRLLYVNTKELVRQPNWHNRQPLGEAAMRESEEIVRSLVKAIETLPDREDILLHQEDGDRWGALHEVAGAAHPNLDIMKILVNAPGGKKLLSQRTQRCQDTPLHIAAVRGQTAVVQVLLDLGANPMDRQIGGHTPLHSAVHHPFDRVKGVIEILLQHCDPTAQDHDSNTPWHYAAKLGRSGPLSLLVQHGPRSLFHAKGKNLPIPIRTAIDFKMNNWIGCIHVRISNRYRDV